MRKFDGDTLVLATHNQGKVDELIAFLAPFGIKVRSAIDFGLIAPVETESSFIGNARIKAHSAAKATGLPALADDSGLTIDALDGAPGVYTADWAEGPDGRDFLVAMNKAWDLIEKSGKTPPFLAQFRCTLVLAWPDGHEEAFEGVAYGDLVWPPRGPLGHGYDPMFRPSGYDKTFAEMAFELKNAISHRADAFRKLTVQCFT